MAQEPVVVTVYHEGEVLDKVVFGGEEEKKPEDQKVRRVEKKKGKVPKYTMRRKYQLPEKPGGSQKLVIEVSRIWVPHEVLGNFDRREMGVGVKILKPDN